MARELWLLRHGKSDRHGSVSDIDRPLKKRGKRAARQIGKWLKERNLVPDEVLTSPAERAEHTVLLVCEELGIDEESVRRDIRLYASSADRLKNVLAEIPAESERVLLVGHNPELERLLIELVGIAHLPGKEKLMPTAALARMAMPEDWTLLPPQCAKLIELVHPKQLSGGN
ncbi:SixA phosphatase family protein [Methylosarcina fibrata]|uniref:SixA phosphatase family protein n=1 Tax=Methylosarcina fibrata TaxID=105972 RepID=UPI000362A69D|nr:histidine phosphatase family protein [Methylosarcina fibrata]